MKKPDRFSFTVEVWQNDSDWSSDRWRATVRAPDGSLVPQRHYGAYTCESYFRWWCVRKAHWYARKWTRAKRRDQRQQRERVAHTYSPGRSLRYLLIGWGLITVAGGLVILNLLGVTT